MAAKNIHTDTFDGTQIQSP